MTAALPTPLLLYLVVWAGLALLRWSTKGKLSWEWINAPAPSARPSTSFATHKLSFTGYALVWEFKLPSSGYGLLLPTFRQQRQGQPQQQSQQGNRGRRGGSSLMSHLGIIFFFIGQVLIVFFLAWNILAALLGSLLFSGAEPSLQSERDRRHLSSVQSSSSFHVSTRIHPMMLGTDGQDWRYVHAFL